MNCDVVSSALCFCLIFSAVSVRIFTSWSMSSGGWLCGSCRLCHLFAMLLVQHATKVLVVWKLSARNRSIITNVPMASWKYIVQGVSGSISTCSQCSHSTHSQQHSQQHAFFTACKSLAALPLHWFTAMLLSLMLILSLACSGAISTLFVSLITLQILS